MTSGPRTEPSDKPIVAVAAARCLSRSPHIPAQPDGGSASTGRPKPEMAVMAGAMRGLLVVPITLAERESPPLSGYQQRRRALPRGVGQTHKRTNSAPHPWRDCPSHPCRSPVAAGADCPADRRDRRPPARLVAATLGAGTRRHARGRAGVNLCPWVSTAPRVGRRW